LISCFYKCDEIMTFALDFSETPHHNFCKQAQDSCLKVHARVRKARSDAGFFPSLSPNVKFPYRLIPSSGRLWRFCFSHPLRDNPYFPFSTGTFPTRGEGRFYPSPLVGEGGAKRRMRGKRVSAFRGIFFFPQGVSK
jgi:hypothetical protein